MVLASDKQTATTLGRVADLFRALNERGIRYCHWKSNVRLELGLRGKTDLDLLVDPEHSQIFNQVLAEHQIKPILAPPGKRYPAIENYLGFDPTTGGLFHLHVHYELVLGEQFVKNYRLPLEDVFLDSVRLQRGVYIPAPELELIVLSLRALLKYRDRDALKDILSIRSSGIPAHILDEIHWLLGQTSIQKVANALAGIPAIIRPAVVLEFLQTVVASPRNGYVLLRLRQRVRRALRVYQRHSRLRASLEYFRELWRRGAFWQSQPGKGMALPGEGVTVALVGVDGAGKTTLCRELARWLSWKLDVRLHYLGSKQPSWLSTRLYTLFRIARRSQRTFSGWFGETHATSRLIGTIRQALLYSHYLSIGLDRYRRHQAGRRDRENGSVVIFDRFPLLASLDGPRVRLAADGKQGLLVDTLARLEQNLYGKFGKPDLMVVLDVRPEVSMRRKPDHSREAIEAKSVTLSKLTAGTEANAGQGNWVHLSAEPPFEDVLRQLKTTVWEAL